jgi:hypothetical protein
MLAIDTYTIKDGIMVKKSLILHPDANKRKIIIANKSSFIGAFIDEGLLGLTGSQKYYIMGENLELILKLLNFKIVNIISHYTKYAQDFLDKDAFKYIPDIRKLNVKNIKESEFYKLIGLTNDELKTIGFL